AQRLVCGAGTTPPVQAFSTTGKKLTHSSARYVRAEALGDDLMAEILEASGSAVVPAAELESGRIVVFPGLSGDVFARNWRAEGDWRANQWDQHAGIFYVEAGRGVTCDDGLGREQTDRYAAHEWHQWLVSAESRYAGGPLEFQ